MKLTIFKSLPAALLLTAAMFAPSLSVAAAAKDGAVSKESAAAKDEVEEVLDEAHEAYKKGQYKLSATRMNQALSLLHQLESQRAHKIFPAPLEGWQTSDDNEALSKFKSMGIGSVFATGLTYSKGEQKVQMVLVQKPSTPQPLFDMLLAGLLMPRPGMEKIPLQDYTGHYLCGKSKPLDCDMSIPVEADYVLMVNGNGVERETLLAYARAIRFDLLKSFR